MTKNDDDKCSEWTKTLHPSVDCNLLPTRNDKNKSAHIKMAFSSAGNDNSVDCDALTQS